MNEMTGQGDKRMTVREVAEVLGVTEESIKKHIRELWPDLMRNGVVTYLSETQVTEIKRKMLPTTSVVGAITDLEAAEMLLRSAEHFKVRFEEERERRIEAERRLALAEPKAAALDGISAGEGDITVRELAAILAMPRVSEKALLQRLHEDGFLAKDGIPIRQYIDRGILYEKFIGKSGKPRLMVTPKGLVHFSMKYAADRCKAENADALRPCTGYQTGKKYGGVWLQGIVDGKKYQRLLYTQDQNTAPVVCRACIKIIGRTVPGFYLRNYIFLKKTREGMHERLAEA
jgi:phage antirepressor YoqD-like protein